MKLTTTFNKLREKHACTDGYRKLAKHLVGVEEYGADKEINILTILESNSFDDAVWSLRATLQDSDKTKRLIAADFAESVLHIFESKRPGDDRPRKAIKASRDFANGLISDEERRQARSAADAAYAYAAASAAYAAASAASAASASAAYAAYAYAAYAAYASAAYAAADASAASAAYAAASAASASASAADAPDAAARKAKKEELANLLRKHLQDDENVG